jgi:hypothetical protein
MIQGSFASLKGSGLRPKGSLALRARGESYTILSNKVWLMIHGEFWAAPSGGVSCCAFKGSGFRPKGSLALRV